MLDKMYWVCSDVLTLASQLSSARDLPSPEVLARRIETLFDNMARKAQEAGIPEADVADAKYALVAFIDEQILRSPWPGRQQWMGRPLQLTYYNENTAGEGFFTKMDQLSREPNRAHVFQIYYLCLALGFQGVYAVRNDGDGLLAMTERGAALLARALPGGENISPHGEPKDSGRGMSRGDAPILALAIGCLALALVAFFVLKLVLGSSTDDAVKTMDQQAEKTAPK
ncbi:MAG: DotU family type IV/VI secretion system protein [Myxococcales bacterium]|nr:DotU family type IV/VI secretion system protein [Myxococcales bacterium]